ncbi:MAG: OmpA family protein [Flavobacteriaceae bacterium]
MSLGVWLRMLKGLAIFLSSATLLAQNLVENPSFEEYLDCPKRLGNFNTDVAHWSTPTIGSTDYFNACSKAMGTPENFNGKQPADFGNGYAGMYMYAPDDYREYIQVPLVKTLEAGKKYSISFYVSLAERSDYAVKEFGVLFSEHKLQKAIKKELSKMQLYKGGGNRFNFMEIGYTNFYKDTKDWILVQTQFVAKGMENFLTIGNFENNVRTRKFKTKRDAKQGAYYYIDMIALEGSGQSEQGDKVKNKEVIANTTFELDKVHTFNNVLFEFDKYQLLETAKADLLKIYNYLEADSSLNIAIAGHTDAIGSASYNKLLSDNRCNSVAQYLMKMGLTEDRISWKGHGGTQPVADNDTEVGRQLNRRVEFVITSSMNK